MERILLFFVKMTLDRIRIKQGSTRETPDGSDLKSGELAISYVNNSLYVGSPIEGGEPILLASSSAGAKAYRDFSIGAVYYVNRNSVLASDAPSNTGQSVDSPFLSIERAIIQGIRENRKSYSIFIYPGFYRVNNAPGVADDTLITAGDINTALENYNHPEGGVIVPPGCSLLAVDPENTIVYPVSLPAYPADPLSSIFRFYAETSIIGLSFRDRDRPTNNDSEVYISESHENLFALSPTDLTNLDIWLDKVNKAFGTLSEYKTVPSSIEVSLERLTFRGRFGFRGVLENRDDATVTINNCLFELNSSAVLATNRCQVNVRDCIIFRKPETTTEERPALDARAGAYIETQSSNLRGESENIDLFGADGFSSSTIGVTFSLAQVIPPAALPTETTPVRIGAIDPVRNWDYYYGLLPGLGLNVERRLYLRFYPEDAESLLPGGVYGVGVGRTIRLATTPGNLLQQDGNDWYIRLDPDYNSPGNFLEGVTVASFNEKNSGSIPVEDWEKINTPFGDIFQGEVRTDLIVDDRSREETLFKVRGTFSTSPSQLRLEGLILNIPGSLSKVYIHRAEKVSGTTFDLTLLRTTVSSGDNTTVTNPYADKDYGVPSYLLANSPTKAALDTNPNIASAVSAAISAADGSPVPVSSPISCTLSRGSLVIASDYTVEGLYNLGAGISGGLLFLGQGYSLPTREILWGKNPIEIDSDNKSVINNATIVNPRLSGEITIPASSRLIIEPGVDLNPVSYGGRASESRYGLAKLASLADLITDSEGDLSEVESFIDTDFSPEDGSTVVSKTVLALWTRSKTASLQDRTDADTQNFSYTKWVAADDVATIDALGLTRIESYTDVVSYLGRPLSGVTTPSLSEQNLTQVVNRSSLLAAFESYAATSAELISGSGDGFISAGNLATDTEFGITKYATTSEKENADTGTGFRAVSYNDLATEDSWGVVRLATLFERQTGSGTGVIGVEDTASEFQLGVVRLASNTELEDASGNNVVAASDKALVGRHGIVQIASTSDRQYFSLGANVITSSHPATTTEGGIVKLASTSELTSGSGDGVITAGDTASTGTYGTVRLWDSGTSPDNTEYVGADDLLELTGGSYKITRNLLPLADTAQNGAVNLLENTFLSGQVNTVLQGSTTRYNAFLDAYYGVGAGQGLLEEPDPENILDYAQCLSLMAGAEATSAQLTNTGNASTITNTTTQIGLVTYKNKPDLSVNPDLHGIVRPHTASRSVGNVLPEDYISVDYLLDSGSGFSQIKSSLIPEASLPINVITSAKDDVYVNAATGDDSNDGLTPGTAFRTIQRGLDHYRNAYIPGDNTYSVIIADGVYTERLVFPNIGGTGYIRLVGNPSNVEAVEIRPNVISTAQAAIEVNFFNPSIVAEVRGVTINLADAPNGVFGIRTNGIGTKLHLYTTGFKGHKSLDSLVFAERGGYIIQYRAIETFGSDVKNVYLVQRSAAIEVVASTTLAVINNNLNVSEYFIGVNTQAMFDVRNSPVITTIGSVTGQRYNVSINSSIAGVPGGNPNYFPGTIAGSASGGGQYV